MRKQALTNARRENMEDRKKAVIKNQAVYKASNEMNALFGKVPEQESTTNITSVMPPYSYVVRA